MRRDLGPKEALPSWLSVRNGSLELACSSSSLESDFSSNTLSIRNGLGPPSRYRWALFAALRCWLSGIYAIGEIFEAWMLVLYLLALERFIFQVIRPPRFIICCLAAWRSC